MDDETIEFLELIGAVFYGASAVLFSIGFVELFVYPVRRVCEPADPCTGWQQKPLVRGMREAASRGFFLASNAPFGYKRVKVNDRGKERPTLEVDPATAPVVREIFESSLRGNGLKEICKELNDRGITNRGKRWYKGTLHYVLRNEAYTGTAVWGRTSKGDKNPGPSY